MSLPNIDHRAVTLRLSTSSFVRGPGYWQFNNPYLKYPVFVDKLNNMLKNALTEEMQISNAQNVPDLTKVKIRYFCIDYGKNKTSKFIDDQPLHAEVLRVSKNWNLLPLEKQREL